MVPLELGTDAGVEKTRMIRLPDRERSLTISSAVWIQHKNVTDGRSDTGRQQRPRLRIASRGNNKTFSWECSATKKFIDESLKQSESEHWEERKTEWSGLKIGWAAADRLADILEIAWAGTKRLEREARSGEWAESAAHNPLTPNISLIFWRYFKLTYPRSAFYYLKNHWHLVS